MYIDEHFAAERKLVRNHKVLFCFVVVLVELSLVTIVVIYLFHGMDQSLYSNIWLYLIVITLLRTMAVLVWCLVTIRKLKNDIKTKYVWLESQYMTSLIAISLALLATNTG